MSRIIGIPPQQLFPNIGFSVPVKSITGAKVDSNETRLRLAQHMSVLQSFGRTDLAALGQLRIGSGGKPVTVLQKSGVLLPTRRGPFKDATDLLFGVAMRSTNRGVFAAVSGVAVVTDSQQPPVSPNAKTVPLDLAYWYGTEIILEDDTTVVLASDIKSLVIIAQTLTIGKNVSISWDRPSAVSPSVPLKPGTPEDYPQADGVWSERGRDGFFGLPGGQGAHGQPAPELELWFLQSTGFPAIDLRGQDGFQGGKGGDGGDGGRGQKGCNTKKNYGFCSQEQGAGGDGGNGGRAGDGGPGGNGGDGGKFTVFAPQLVINAWLQGGLTISVDGGNVGSGGDPGRPGEGGPGGDKGDKLHTVCQNNNRQPGVKGNTGPSASRGPDGKKGVLLIDPIRFSSISQSDFNIELTKPAIVSIWPRAAYVSDTVSVNGLRFVPGDMIFIEGMDGQINVPCETTFVSDTLLTFKVPNVPGGYALIEAVQSDGTRSSSRGTLVIRPRIETVIPTGRVRPGEYYFIRGTGLGRSGNIWINNEGIGPFESVDNTTVKFKARRPSNAESNSSGERVKLKVVNAEGAGLGSPNHSPEIDIVLDTYRILAFGDSVLWGGG
ncbi:MAG TPA: hypothetical protein VLR90_18835, partial [Blastocatellia bacterium]|nr:hypothetical protein [Blastocatellia bacterium]